MPEVTITNADGDEFPLSPEQTRLLLAKKFTGRGSDLMNLHTVLHIEGPLDRVALSKTLERICIDNEALRTRLVVRPEGLRQAVFSTVPQLQFIDDYRDQPATDLDRIKEFISDIMWREFDLEQDILLRSILVSLSDRKHIFGFVTSHFVSDATSHGIMLRYIREWYAHFAANGDAPRQRIRRRYRDFALERNLWEQNDAARDLPYWESVIEGIRPTTLEKNPQPSPLAPRIVAALSKADLIKLQQFARDQRMTFFAILLTVTFCFLFLFTKEKKVATIVSRDGRHHPSYYSTIGHFALACPTSAERSSGLSLGQFLQQVWNSWTTAMSHPWIPSQLRQLVAIPLFVGYLEADILGAQASGENAQSLSFSQFPILPAPGHKAPGVSTIFFSNTRDGLEICLTQPEPELQYFESEAIMRTLRGMLSKFIDSCDKPLDDFIRGY